jgi:hypothetical protein
MWNNEIPTRVTKQQIYPSLSDAIRDTFLSCKDAKAGDEHTGFYQIWKHISRGINQGKTVKFCGVSYERVDADPSFMLMDAKNKQIIENLQLSLNLAIATLGQNNRHIDSLNAIFSKANDTESKVLDFCDGEVPFDEVLEYQESLISMLKFYVFISAK